MLLYFKISFAFIILPSISWSIQQLHRHNTNVCFTIS